MDGGLGGVVGAGGKLGDEPAGGGADPHCVHPDAAVARELQRVVHLAAPGLAVRQHDERLGAQALAVELGVALEHLHAPVDALLDVGVPARVVLEAERGLVAEMIQEEEQGVGIAGQPDLRGRAVGEEGEGDALVLPAEELGERPDPRHRPLPAVRGHVAHAHRCRAVLQDDEVGAGAPGDGDQRLGARESERQGRDGEQQAEPEREPAGEGEPLRDRRRPPAARGAGVAPAPRELPQP